MVYNIIRKEFEVHILNDDGLVKAKDIALLSSNFLTDLEAIVGTSEGREMSIVRTKLEEVVFFAKKAMASIPEHQKES